ncbi:threonine--tRNA ligase [Candidatus Marinarcus aquaticus]|uniref:Threonine--tRNA ligase n=1 Tax=Candidatus Marinarcus aquaticus TaxID=2044504 RepID=A0A4Q0XTI1_9BACT|nr:threonine--tRNA ligase [Candidatus Marinarcus aquaticus]RXJ60887.1 threonine--tRNA ligase [Candidatus Marinarcus aquaticus]
MQKMNDMDHRILGKKLELFMFSELSPGMAFWLPQGSKLKNNLKNIIYKSHILRDYEYVESPAMMEDKMWKISGHYENYKENMFPSIVEKKDYLLKPMNCPMHILMYQNSKKSYKELPIRYFEFGQVHRNELSGVLHGLFRVREFVQDDSHIICMPEQLENEILSILDFIKSLLSFFDFEYRIDFSSRPDKSIGSDENWEKAENSIKNALSKFGQEYQLNEGDGAFYGPKIDIKIKDIHKREWQLGSIQVDYNLPQRFNMKYIDNEGKEKQPIIIHRAILGSIERFIGILLEHYKGVLPVCISPNQLAIVPIASNSQSQMQYIEKFKKELLLHNINVKIYNSDDSLNRRIKNSENDKNPLICVVGDNEVRENSLNIRDKLKKENYQVSLNSFIEYLKNEMDVVV